MRPDGRRHDELRQVKITRDFISSAEGSVLIELGGTRVICTASIEERVPMFLKEQNRGWVTAEYSMLPRATQVRTLRESTAGRISGRTHEIQRLIGRSLRSVIDLEAIGQRTFWIDCDVIRADGGTRTAAITGSFICLADAFNYAIRKGLYPALPENTYSGSILAALAIRPKISMSLFIAAAICSGEFPMTVYPTSSSLERTSRIWIVFMTSVLNCLTIR